MFTVLAPVPEPGTGYEPIDGGGFPDLHAAQSRAFELAADGIRYGPCTYAVAEQDSQSWWTVTVDPGRDGSPALLRVVHDGQEQTTDWYWGVLRPDGTVRRLDDTSIDGLTADGLADGESYHLYVDVGDLTGQRETTTATKVEVEALANGDSHAG